MRSALHTLVITALNLGDDFSGVHIIRCMSSKVSRIEHYCTVKPP